MLPALCFVAVNYVSVL